MAKPPNALYKETFATDDVASLLEQVGGDRATIKNVYDFGVGDVLIHNNKKGKYAKSLFGNDGNFNLMDKNIYRAAVPLTVATACLDPVNSAIFSSNSVTLAPTEETKFESIQSIKYCRSLPSKTGR